MSGWEWLFIGAIVVLVLLPPKWDPAIRLKEYNIKWAEELQKKREKRDRI